MPTTVIPIINQNSRFQFWKLSEIFVGPSGPPESKYVPNVDDAVWDWNTGLYRVTAVNSLTNESTLVPHSFTNLNAGVIDEDTLLSSGPSRVSESFRVYVDPTAFPYRLAVDARLHCFSSEASYIKIFQGADIGPTGHVISAMFDNMNVFQSENIPLTTVGIHDITNLSIKAPALGFSTDLLADNDLVTCVIYSSTNAVLYAARMIVMTTNFVHSTDLTKKFIVGIELLSPYLSVTDNHLLEYPVNMLVQSGSLQGRVTYNDATFEDLPIDGNRFVLTGLNRYVATEAGNHADLTLIYNLQPNEYAYGVSSPVPNRFIQEEYRITTIPADGAYTVKLFITPYWNATLGKWSLDYYLYDLDRDTKILATPFIESIINTPAFDGSLLNTWQFLTVAVNLNAVDNAYLSYRYVQTFAIQLKAGGTNTISDDFYLLEYTQGITFGAGLRAHVTPDTINTGQKRINISQNLSTVEDWLDRVYRPIKPLRIVGEESVPPLPTHVIVRVGATWVRELLIGNVVNLIENVTIPLVNGGTVYLEFIKRDSSDLELGIVSLNIVQ